MTPTMADGEVLGSNLEFIVLVRPGTSAATKIQLLSLCFVSFVASALDFAPEPALGSVDKRCAAPSSRGKKFKRCEVLLAGRTLVYC
jgi:hypothetical protein